MNKPETVNEWQEMFVMIYGDANSVLDPTEIWLHLVEELGEVATDLRKENRDKLRKDLPDVFAWLCGFAERTGFKVEDVAWDKYPGVCPYCKKERLCVCIGGTYQSYDRDRISAYRRQNHRRPVSLADWEKMFHRIYGNVNTIVMTSAIGFHLMEEVGEVAKALRSPNHIGLDEEIADVFAWIIALSMKNKQFGPLGDFLWETYPGICKHCHRCPCTCSSKLDSLIPRG